MSGFIPRILIVDDQAELLEEVSGYFRRKGEVVSTATCFKEAQDVLVANSPPVDVLISDGRMPDGNGIDLIRGQLARADGRCICILMTGHLDQSQVAADLGNVKVFFKPFAVAALHRAVRSALAGTAASPQQVVRLGKVACPS